jgi:hypothetical protein
MTLTGTLIPSGVPKFILGFSWVRVFLSLVVVAVFLETIVSLLFLPLVSVFTLFYFEVKAKISKT